MLLRPQWFRSYTKHVPFGTAGCNNWLIARPSLVNSNTSVLVGMKEEKKWLYFQSHWLLTSANFDWRLPMFLWCLQMIGGSLCILAFFISAAMSTFGKQWMNCCYAKIRFQTSIYKYWCQRSFENLSIKYSLWTPGPIPPEVFGNGRTDWGP